MREVATDTTKIQRLITKQCEQLQANKLNILVEMDKFLETCNLLRLSQEEKNLNKHIYKQNGIGNLKKKKKLPANRSSAPGGFMGEFY